jgi:hypothetical protein
MLLFLLKEFCKSQTKNKERKKEKIKPRRKMGGIKRMEEFIHIF